MPVDGAIARRLLEREIQSEQRRQQVVLKAAGLLAKAWRHGIGVEKLHERLLRIQPGGDESRVQSFAVGKLDADSLSLAREDAMELYAGADRAAVLFDIPDE